ncbi:hypothetical protein PR202_gb25157 [Eleusine coracana subsp. coracana]|uniref:Pentatricopeptide repeat-containing protein n=1 Tax=Eleusine coracana subsp. coracana TaxID=191504 RepID=A0AAV5FP97_ELECO|nr:hypothetical protein PR202_gb25157 [Eleusine coracana subsp. coracana]
MPAAVSLTAATCTSATATISELLLHCPSLSAVKQVHAHLLLRSHLRRPFPYNYFLSKLLSLPFSNTTAAATSDYALLLLASHPSPTAFSYNVAIRFFASSCPATSLRLFLCMLRAALRPDAYTLPFLLLAAARCPAPALARSTHALLEKIGLRDHDHTVHSLITMYSNLSDPLAARRVFDRIAYQDVVSWNSMLKAYERAGMSSEVAGMFRSMVEEGKVAPNGVTMAVVLSSCRGAGDLVLGRWVEEWVRSTGMVVDSLIGSALVGMYEKCGEIEEARRVFDGIADKDVVAWNAMITGQLGTELDKYASRRGLYSNVYVGTSLVDMYAKCGDLDKAIQVFQKMPSKNEASWNALICGLAFNGRGHEAIQQFELMRREKGLQPDDITFIGIEHYSCMVDLLARAGHLEEAWYFLEKVPGKVDAVMLGALLAACRKCKNVEVGERVMHRIMKLEPSNSWNYVVSSKIYATTDRLDDSARMIGLMRERGVSKTPGCSWVEVNGKVLEFYASTEPQHGAEEMYELMDTLVDDMRLEGYVPNLDLV